VNDSIKDPISCSLMVISLLIFGIIILRYPEERSTHDSSNFSDGAAGDHSGPFLPGKQASDNMVETLRDFMLEFKGGRDFDVKLNGERM
jgi:hypothetical protein